MRKLKILFVEDFPTDVEIAIHEISKEKIDFSYLVVETAQDFKKALVEFEPNLIISDYSMPQFDGMTALKIARAQADHIPFIVLTGSMNEETAVACMKAGADDYVIKEKIKRLPFAVREVLQKKLVENEKDRALQELHLSKEKYQLLISSLNEGLMQVDNNDRILFVNRAMCDMFGYEREELIGKIGHKILILEEDQETIKVKNRSRFKIPSEKYQIRGKKKNGEIIWISISGSAMRDEKGNVIGSVGLLTDITERKKAEEALKISEARYRQHFDNVSDIIYSLDRDYRIIDVSPSVEKLMGYKPKELIGNSFHELNLIHPEDLQRAAADVLYIFEGNEIDSTQYRFITKKGNIKWGEVSGSPMIKNGQIVACISVARDVTERKKMEEKVRKSERENAFLAKSAFELVNLESMQNIYKFTARKMHELMEKTGIVTIVEYEIDSNLWKMKHIEGIDDRIKDLTKIVGFDIRNLSGDIKTKYYDKIISGKLTQVDFNLPILFNNKISKKIEKTIKKLFSIDKMYCIMFQQNEKIFGNITLITDRKTNPLNKELIEAFVLQVSNFVKKQKAQDALKESEAKFRSLIDSSNDGICLHDLQGKILFTNDRKLELLGYDEERQILGTNVLDLLQESEKEKFRKMSSTLMERGFLRNIETEVIKKNGTSFPVDLNFTVITDNKGNPKYVMDTMRDITDRKRAEAKLKKSEMLFRALFTDSLTPIFMVDEDRCYINANQAALDFMECSKEKLIGRSVFDFSLPEKEKQMLREHAEFPESKTLETYYLINGKIKILLLEVTPLDLDDEKILVGIGQNITERKQALISLQESEEKFKVIFQNNPIGIATTNEEGVITSINEAFTNWIGLQQKEIAEAKKIINIPSFRKFEHKKKLQELISDHKPFDFETELKNYRTNQKFYIRFRGFSLGEEATKKLDFMIMLGNITERKIAEKKIREKDIQFRKLSANLPDMIYQFTRKKNGEYCFPIASAGINNIYGCDPEDVAEDFSPVEKVLHPEDKKRLFSQIDYSAKHLTNFTSEFRVKLPNKPIQWILSRSTPEKLPNGNVTWYGFNANITKRKQDEEALKESKARFSAFMDNLPITTFIKDKKHKILYVNNEMKKVFSSSDWLGKTPYDILPEKVAQELIEADEESFAKGYGANEHRVPDRSGKERIWETHVFRIDRENQEPIIGGFALDITKRKQTEEKIKRNLEEKNLLLRELYHRTKNNMQVIASMLRLQAHHIGSEELQKAYQEIIIKINSMALVHQKLYEAKDLSLIDLKEFIADLTHLLMRNFPDARTNVKPQLKLQKIFVNIDTAIPLSVVLTELISNIYQHAIPENGKVIMKIKLYRDADQRVIFELSDNGKGIPENIDLRKSKSMGLRNVFSITEYQLNGIIEYYCKNGLHWKIIFDHDFKHRRV